MRRIVPVALLCLGMPMSAALAKKPEKHAEAPLVEVDVDVNLVFTPAQRDIVRRQYVAHYGRGHCPPGLAKKDNGCLPPGQARKRYDVGKALPPGVVVIDLPGDLQVRLGTPPRGTRYGVVDGDVVKLALGTLLVIDAIDGLTN